MSFADTIRAIAAEDRAGTNSPTSEPRDYSASEWARLVNNAWAEQDRLTNALRDIADDCEHDMPYIARKARQAIGEDQE